VATVPLPPQSHPTVVKQFWQPAKSANLTGYANIPNGAPQMTSGEIQQLTRCDAREFNASRVCAILRLKARRKRSYRYHC